MATVRPFDHPSLPSVCSNAATRGRFPGSSSACPIKTPIRRIRSGCCARAASGHAAAAPPSSVMNERRLMPDMRLLPAAAA